MVDNSAQCIYCSNIVGKHREDVIEFNNVEVTKYYHNTILRHCFPRKKTVGDHHHFYELTVKQQQLALSGGQRPSVRILNSQIFGTGNCCVPLSSDFGRNYFQNYSENAGTVRHLKLLAPDISYKEVCWTEYV